MKLYPRILIRGYFNSYEMNIRYLILLLLFPFCQGYTQSNSDTLKLERSIVSFGSSYGLSYNPRNKDNYFEFFNMDIPVIGSYMEFSVDFLLKDDRSIGIGFGRGQQSRRITGVYLRNGDNTGVYMEDFLRTSQTKFIDIHFRRKVVRNFYMTTGLYFYRTHMMGLSREFFEGVSFFVIQDEMNRVDDLGMVIAPEYIILNKENASIGVKANGYLTWDGFTSLTLSPVLRVRF
jgi:hypothetical protein